MKICKHDRLERSCNECALEARIAELEDKLNTGNPLLKDVIELLSNKEFEYLKGDKLIERIKPTHGSCCCCQTCGRFHDDCVCSHNELLIELMKLSGDAGKETK